MLFISHSSRDLETVRALAELCGAALNIHPKNIRATSLDGYRLPGGSIVGAQLRKEVCEAAAFIGLISSASLRSTYVAFELGARWGTGKHLVPLLAPGVDNSILEAPLSDLHSLSCSSSSQLHQLVEELARVLGTELNPAANYHPYIESVLALPPGPARPPTPKYLRKELELDLLARKGRLTPSQISLLEYLELQARELESVSQKEIEKEFRGRFEVYWRLETLCYLGFVEKQRTGTVGGTPRYNHLLSSDYRTALLAGRD